MKPINLRLNKTIGFGIAVSVLLIVCLSFINIDRSSTFVKKVESDKSGYTQTSVVQDVNLSVRYFPAAYSTIKQLKKTSIRITLLFSEVVLAICVSLQFHKQFVDH